MPNKEKPSTPLSLTDHRMTVLTILARSAERSTANSYIEGTLSPEVEDKTVAKMDADKAQQRVEESARAIQESNPTPKNPLTAKPKITISSE